eukprot:c7537_g1_i2.p1 GENE.c7537_g1_i2~~c7537_g1_i2.p1  ORF type:complete len:562 (+),score=94.39 c7537_g1_i2:281-1966(+)
MWTNASEGGEPTSLKKGNPHIIKTGWVMHKENRLSPWSLRWLVVTPNAFFVFECPQQSLTQATSILVLAQPVSIGVPMSSAIPVSRPPPLDPQANTEPVVILPSHSSNSPTKNSTHLCPPPKYVGVFGRERMLSLQSSTKKIWIKMCHSNDTDRTWLDWLQALQVAMTENMQFPPATTITTDLDHYLSVVPFNHLASLRTSANSQICRADPLHESKLALIIPRKSIVSTKSSLADCARLDFNIFNTNDVSGSRAIRAIGYHCANSLGLLHKVHVSPKVFRRWLAETERGYDDYAFHCNIHAADVTQTTYYVLRSCGFQTFLDPLEALCCLMAALTHDICHPALTNQYIQASGHPLSKKYAQPILENYHVDRALKNLSKTKFNVFRNLSKAQQAKAQRWIRELVLATDMGRHFDSRWEFNSMTDSADGFDLADSEARLLIMQYVIHCADIANPTKPWPIYAQWTRRIMTEFYNQGDLEKKNGLKVSMFMDRDCASDVTEARCQIGFTDTFVQPLFITLARFVRRYCPDHVASADQFVINLVANRKMLKDKLPHHDIRGRPSL